MTMEQRMFDSGEPNAIEVTDDWFVQHLPSGARMYRSAGWYRVTLGDGRHTRVSSLAAVAIDAAWFLYNGTGRPLRRVARFFSVDSTTGELRPAEACQCEFDWS